MLDGHFTTFHNIIPTIHQDILLVFKQIYIPPIDLSLFKETNDVELNRVSHMNDMIAHLTGKRSLFEEDVRILASEQIVEENNELQHVCFSAIRVHEEAKRALT